MYDHISDNNKQPKAEIVKQFGLPENDTCALQIFNCAYKNKILLQGKIYLFRTKLCFHSNFNNQTIVGQGTVLAIDYQNIASVRKSKLIKIINNSVQVTTVDQKSYFFTSFLKRD